MGKKHSNETTNKLSVFFLGLAVNILKSVPDEGRINEISKELEIKKNELEVELDIKKFKDKNGDK